jgi:hypothetical protein
LAERKDLVLLHIRFSFASSLLLSVAVGELIAPVAQTLP